MPAVSTFLERVFKIMKIANHILWIDCTAAAFAGLIVLLAAQWLSQLYHLPKGIIVFMGCVNLLYASYSFTLANYKKRSMLLINILITANSIWVLVCLVMLWKFWQEMTFLPCSILLERPFL